ncbi:hypothetical protein GJ496_001129 [Pomphorhynchus laevis]|nr:hypothetical protein GJ496_001129 [Pomphorhynchus laevis]
MHEIGGSQAAIFASYQFIIALYAAFLLIFGTIGNMLSLYILLVKIKPHTRSIVITALLCIPETIILYTWNMNYIYRELIRRQSYMNLEETSLIHCKLISFIAYTSFHCSAWLRCYLCFNRWLSMKNINTDKETHVRATVITCAVIVLIFISVNVHVIVFNGYKLSSSLHYGNYSLSMEGIAKGELTMGVYDDKTIKQWTKYLSQKKIRCYARKHHYKYFKPNWGLIHYTLYSFVPSIVMTFFDFQLVYMIRHTASMERDKTKTRILRNMSNTINGMNIMFILCSVPSAIIHTVIDPMFLKGKHYRQLILMMAASLDNTLHASLFPVYVILLRPVRKFVTSKLNRLI